MQADIPIISVVIPLFDKEREIARAVSAVLSQTFQDFELIIVNDGSTDKGPEIARSFSDRRIRVIDQSNKGVSAARNRGIQEARSDLIAFLDADDEWMPEFLSRIYSLVSDYPESSVYATNYYYWYGENSFRLPSLRGMPHNFTTGRLDDYFLIASRSDPPLNSSTVVVRREAMEEVGGFPIDITVGEDLLTWARLAARFSIAYDITPSARFWQIWSDADKHKRLPQIPDHVGIGLALLKCADGEASLKRYLALWHTMRASIYLQHKLSTHCREEIQKAKVLSDKFDTKLLMLHILSYLPFKSGALALSGLMMLRRKISSLLYSGSN